MNVLGIIATAGRLMSEEIVTDSNGDVTTHHWLLPETAEIIYGGLASLIIFYALFKFGGPLVKKSFAARTEKIQKELDAAAADKSAAATEAAGIRAAKGDIAAERARLLSDAETQAAAVLEGRRTACRDRTPLVGRRRPCGHRLARRRHPARTDRELHCTSWSERMSDNQTRRSSERRRAFETVGASA